MSYPSIDPFVLYVVIDTKNKKVSYPLTAPNMFIAKKALHEMNPENLDDLELHELCTVPDLHSLFSINTETETSSYIPDSLLLDTSSDCETIAEDTSEAREVPHVCD